MIGDIDTTIPVGLTHLIERKDSIFQQHGGVVTAINFNKLEEMTLEKFINDVIPTLKEKPKGKFVIIKDPVRDTMYRILNDNVAVYSIKQIQDVFLDTFMDNLLSERPMSITPNLTYPLIKYATTKDGEKVITVAIPPKQFTYHTVEDMVAPFVVWHPPLWFQCKLTPTNTPNGVRVGVVLDRTDDPKDAIVYHLPLPNCYPDGSICFGYTRYEGPTNEGELTEATAIELTYQRLFNSAFNRDLLQDREMHEFVKLCSTLPDYKDFKDEIDDHSTKGYVTRVKYGWRDKASIWKYNYTKMCDGLRFLS